jgi:hypothetical protein
MKGGFGFPVTAFKGSSPRAHSPAYRADTSRHKQDLIYILRRSELLWNKDQKQESLVLLRKAITILTFIITNESIEAVKIAYQDKQKELKLRLKNR